MSIGTLVKKEFSLMAILLIPIAVAINFVGGALALSLKLPLYLDSIGTFLVAMLAGPLVGAVTGALSLVVVSAADPTSLPWVVVASTVGAIVGYLARRGMFNSVTRVALSIAIVVLVSTTLVVVIRYVVFGGFNTSGSSMIAAGLIAAGVPFFVAQVASSLAAEIPDKALSVLLALLVVRSLSDRYLIKFANGHVLARGKKSESSTPAGPMSSDEVEAVDEDEPFTDYGSYGARQSGSS
jgi:energy-coupling factor transport system substrate-specific component